MDYPKPDKVAVGKRIRQARERLNMMGVELAAKAGIKPHTLWRNEAGKSLPQSGNLDRIAETLGVDSEWLLRGDAKEAEDGGVYPAFAEWLERMAPDDLDPRERDALAGLFFREGNPDPVRYDVILEQMRSRPRRAEPEPSASNASRSQRRGGNSRSTPPHAHG